MKRMTRMTMVVMFVLVAHVAAADPIAWTDWTYANSVTGTAGGLLTPSAAPLTMVTYTGRFSFAQVMGAGENYWIPDTPYLSSVVSNAPPGTDIVALDLSSVGYVNNIHFSAPVMDPVMAIVSMGRDYLPVYYDFRQEFSVLSFGPGYWGGPGTLTNLGGGRLEGIEGHGAIQFHGLVSDITWTNSPDEYWHGFTVGVPDTAAPVPEPASLLLFGTGLVGAAGRAWRKRRQ